MHDGNVGGVQSPAGGALTARRIEVLRSLAAALLTEVEGLCGSEPLDLTAGVSTYEELRRYEAEIITRTLALTGGHQRRAARLLGMKATTLNAKIKRYGITLHERPLLPKLRRANDPAEVSDGGNRG